MYLIKVGCKLLTVDEEAQMYELTLVQLKTEVRDFVQEFSTTPIPILYGVTDGKAVGTYIEQAFHKYLIDRYS